MNFDSILQYLQGLLSGKQAQQNTQFGANNALQTQQVSNQNTQFGENLGLQKEQLVQQGNQFDKTLGLQTQAQNSAEKLAQDQLAQQKQQQAAAQNLAWQQFMQSLLPAVSTGTTSKTSADPYGLNWGNTNRKPNYQFAQNWDPAQGLVG